MDTPEPQRVRTTGRRQLPDSDNGPSSAHKRTKCMDSDLESGAKPVEDYNVKAVNVGRHDFSSPTEPVGRLTQHSVDIASATVKKSDKRSKSITKGIPVIPALGSSYTTSSSSGRKVPGSATSSLTYAAARPRTHKSPSSTAGAEVMANEKDSKLALKTLESKKESYDIDVCARGKETI
jgi:hypothetical protein